MTEQQAHEAVFLVAGYTALTLIICAPTTGPLLRYLGLAATSSKGRQKQNIIAAGVKKHVEGRVKELIRASGDTRIDAGRILAAMPDLGVAPNTTLTIEHPEDPGWMVLMRKMYLKIIGSKISSLTDSGDVWRNSPLAATLEASLEHAEDYIHHDHIDDSCLVFESVQEKLRLLPSTLACDGGMLYLDAAREARDLIPVYMHGTQAQGDRDPVMKFFLPEADRDLALAEAFVREFPAEEQNLCRAARVTRRALFEEMRTVQDLHAKGVLETRGAQRLLRDVYRVMDNINEASPFVSE